MSPIPRKYKKWLAISLPALVIFIAGFAYMYEHTSTTNYCGTTCHIMEPLYESQLHSAHREGIVECKDCHLPHDNFLHQVVYKGYSGAKDIYKNTFAEPVVLHTTTWSQNVANDNCIRCHQAVVDRIQVTDGLLCFDCHRHTPHGQGTQSFGFETISTPIR